MENKLEKNWKHKMIVALGATVLAAPTQIHNPEKDHNTPTEDVIKEKTRPSVTIKDFSMPFGEHPQDKFLRPISYLESSGGKNTDHSVLQYGLHAGDQAMGKFALMPKTVRNVASMLNNNGTKLRQRLGEDYKDDEVQSLHSLDDNQLVQKVKGNGPLKLRIARYLATHLHELHNGDMARMAHGWRFGHNRGPTSITPEMLEGSGYVRKFNELLHSEDK
jgi:hypothetical protein